MNTKSSHPPITVNISIDETEVNMEVDTGASATLITKSTMEKVWPVKKPTLCTENNLLRTYTGEIVPICGTTVMNLQYIYILCPLCSTHEHTTQHLFSCPQIPTTLSALDLWRDPSGVAALLDDWREKLAANPHQTTEADSPQ